MRRWVGRCGYACGCVGVSHTCASACMYAGRIQSKYYLEMKTRPQGYEVEEMSSSREAESDEDRLEGHGL